MSDANKNKKKEGWSVRSSASEYLTYIASTGTDGEDTGIEMRYEDENIWLTQKLMAQLYDVEPNTINYHIKKILADSELQENSVIRKFRITALDGKTYNTNHYLYLRFHQINYSRIIVRRQYLEDINFQWVTKSIR